MRLSSKFFVGLTFALTLSACSLIPTVNPQTSTSSGVDSQEAPDKANIKRLSEAARAASVTKELTKSAAEAAAESSALAQQARENPGDEGINAKADAAAEETEALIDKAGDEAEAAVNAKPSNAVTTAKASQWQGFGFGVGASLTLDLGNDDRVGSASVDANNIVRIDDEDNAIARIILETHYFGNCSNYAPTIISSRFNNWLGDGRCGVGPFVAIQPGENDIIDAIGFGLMAGFQRPNQPADDNTSFNIGIGVIVDPDATVLGSGISENAPLPDGETDVRTREEAQYGLLLLTSFAFN